jgi:hypothetical protein
LLLEVPPIVLRSFDVSCLRTLVATAEEDHDGVSFSSEVDAIARSSVDAKLVNAFAHGAGITEVAQANPSDASPNLVAGCSIPKSSKPPRERLSAVRPSVDANLLLGRHLNRVALKLLIAI